jgi:hypothetical protein
MSALGGKLTFTASRLKIGNFRILKSGVQLRAINFGHQINIWRMPMRKAFGLVLAGLGAAAIAGVAVAANRDTHVMNVPLPDGSTARVEYVGDVAPKVTVVPGAVTSFGLFDRSMFDMERQIDAMMRQVGSIARDPMDAGAIPGMNVAAYGNGPTRGTSVTVISTGNGAKTCTRTTEVTAQGPGKPPKVATSISGDCGTAPAPTAKPTA